MSVDLPEFGFPTIATIKPDRTDSEKLKPLISSFNSFSRLIIGSLIWLIKSNSSTSS